MTGQPDEPRLPVAYCARGQKLAATLALILLGHDFARVTETQFLEGTDVILVTDPGPFKTSPIPPSPVVRTDLPDRDWSFRLGLRYGALVNRPIALGPIYL